MIGRYFERRYQIGNIGMYRTFDVMYKDENNGCIVVAKFLKNKNNPWNTWNLYTRYSIERKTGLLNTVQIIEFE